MAQCEVDMDKRVVKTKRTIKRTLVELLATMPFEKITVTELCRRRKPHHLLHLL